MVDAHLARTRLATHGLSQQRWGSAVEVVTAYGCTQGQDLSGVIASIALRTGAASIGRTSATSTGRTGATSTGRTGADSGVEEVVAAFNSGEIVRGYPMRGTLFVTAAADLRWITELCAAGSRTYDAKSRAQRGITDAVLDAVHDDARAHLTHGLSRDGLADILVAHGIDPKGGNLYRVIASLLLDCRAAWGPIRDGEQLLVDGQQALGGGLEERFNGDRIAAVAELAARYFATHGPATERDFAWWSKLPLRDIRAALPHLDGITRVGEDSYAPVELTEQDWAAPARDVRLLPGFDEFILGYRDRLFAMTEQTHEDLVPGNNGIFRKSVVVGGTVRGFWSTTGPRHARRLDLSQASVPAYAEPGLRRRFVAYPFF